MNKPEFEFLFPKPVLTILVGLPGSGKSTVAEQLKKSQPNVEIFSSDEYRERYCGDVNNQTKNEKIFRLLYTDLREALLLGKNCILDATNINRKARKKCLEKFSDLAIETVAYFVDTEFEVCIQRDAQRSRTVGKGVIEKFLHMFEFPQYFEGFDRIYIHSKINTKANVYNQKTEEMFLNQMNEFDQHNSHHMYTVGEHCSRLALQINTKKDRVMHEAGWFHDVGKLYTQKFDENGIAHYYNHDSVGAYVVACHPEVLYEVTEWYNVYEVIFYINYHMRAHHDLQGHKAQDKYRKLFGDDRFNKLMQFGEYDRIASGTYEGEN